MRTASEVDEQPCIHDVDVKEGATRDRPAKRVKSRDAEGAVFVESEVQTRRELLSGHTIEHDLKPHMPQRVPGKELEGCLRWRLCWRGRWRWDGRR